MSFASRTRLAVAIVTYVMMQIRRQPLNALRPGVSRLQRSLSDILALGHTSDDRPSVTAPTDLVFRPANVDPELVIVIMLVMRLDQLGDQNRDRLAFSPGPQDVGRLFSDLEQRGEFCDGLQAVDHDRMFRTFLFQFRFP